MPPPTRGPTNDDNSTTGSDRPLQLQLLVVHTYAAGNLHRRQLSTRLDSKPTRHPQFVCPDDRSATAGLAAACQVTQHRASSRKGPMPSQGARGDPPPLSLHPGSKESCYFLSLLRNGRCSLALALSYWPRPPLRGLSAASPRANGQTEQEALRWRPLVDGQPTMGLVVSACLLTAFRAASMSLPQRGRVAVFVRSWRPGPHDQGLSISRLGSPCAKIAEATPVTLLACLLVARHYWQDPCLVRRCGMGHRGYRARWPSIIFRAAPGQVLPLPGEAKHSHSDARVSLLRPSSAPHRTLNRVSRSRSLHPHFHF